MATVSEDLLNEGRSLLKQREVEEIQKFADRIISVEPDNWYGLFMRGCGYALECDFSNSVVNWKNAISGIEDENVVSDLCNEMIDHMAYCILRLPAGVRLDFSQVGDFLIMLNDKLPESDEEVFVTSVLTKGADYLKENMVDQPLMTYFAFKAMAVASVRAYVELNILVGFFEKITEINRSIHEISEGKLVGALDNDKIFLDEICAAMRSAIDNCPSEVLEKIEEYWLEHNPNTYASHLFQAYQMSGAVATAGKITSKIAKKVMLGEIQVFIKTYLNAKI